MPGGEPIVLVWDLRTTAPVAEAWATFSDTERFNRVAGNQFRFTEEAGERGTVNRRGKARQLGLPLSWRELPPRYRAPEWMKIERVYDGGPLDRYAVVIHLVPTDTGTDIRYEVTLQPRSRIGRMLVRVTADRMVRPMLNQTLGRLIASLDGEAGAFDLAPPALPAATGRRLAEITRRLEPPVFGERLRRLIESAPLEAQDRIQAFKLAEDWGLSEEVALRACLEAVREGALSLRWDIICPSCLGAKERLATLEVGARTVHCDSCNIAYDANFPSSVAVSFRPAPGIRDFEVPVACLSAASRTPHLVARALLTAQQETCINLDLDEGNYLLRSFPDLPASSLEVVTGAPAGTLVLDVGKAGFAPAVLRVGPGPVEIRIRSRFGDDLEVALERRWRPPHTLTAGRLLATPGAAELLPSDAVSPGLEVEVLRAGVLVVEAFRGREAAVARLKAVIEEAGPRCLHVGDRALVATWPTFGEAIHGASLLQGVMHMYSAVGVGSVAEIGQDGQVVPAGVAVDRALAALRGSIPGGTAVPAEVAADPEVSAAIEAGVGNVAKLLMGPEIEGRRSHRLAFTEGTVAVEALTAPLPELLGPPPEVEDVLCGRYALRGVIGRGGFGAVYAALDVDTGAEIVVKILHTELLDDPSHVQRFYNEGRAVSLLNSPHAVRLLDFGTTETGRVFLAMEFLEGLELHEILGSSRMLNPGRACHLALDVLRCLAEAHRLGIVHRDLKPSNIFVCRDEAGHDLVKVIDFGIAKDTTANAEDITERGLVFGTPRYMSPEQVGMGTMDRRSDLYSLGLVLYRCLAGHVPLSDDGEGLVLVIRRIQGPIPSVASATDQEIPPSLDRLVMKSLLPEQKDRYQRAEEMIADLEIALADLGDDPERAHTPAATTEPGLPASAATAPEDVETKILQRGPGSDSAR
jgi:hypothetical protein